MAEENNSEQTEQNTESKQQFVLQKIYVKDLSFETPNSPEIFTQDWKPDVNVQLDTKGKKLAEDTHEVTLGVTVTVKIGEKTAYLVEVYQAAIITTSGNADEELGALLGSYCPNILYPYAREAITDLVSKGGFPQILLQPVNFDAIYRDHLARQQQQAGDESVH